MTYDFPDPVRQRILDRDLSRCARCGRFLPSGAHLHHRKLRSQGGAGLVQNGVTLCTTCHDHIHAHPASSRAAGFIVAGWADPEVTPIVTWRGTGLLSVDGTFVDCETGPEK